jgi:2-methylcitrate dehydratase PrpD
MLLHDIADYAVAERTNDIPELAFHWAKRAVIDWCASTAPGSFLQPASGLTQALAEDIGHGKARLFPSGGIATVRTAAIINAAASHTVEFDDIFRDAIYHPSTPVVSTALAVAEGENLSGKEFLRAVIVGYEVSTRIALVLGRAHYRYWHNTATIGSFGAAAAAATALKLDRDQTAHALALVGTMAAGLQQAFRSDSDTKPMHGAHAADTGIMCAQSAKHGIRGVMDMLDGEVGVGAAMSENCDWSIATEGLGEHYNITVMTTKNHGCCGHTFAAIDAALAIKEQHGVTAADIESIDIGGYSSTVEICSGHDHITPYDGRFSVPYLVATAFTHGTVRLDAFSEERLTHPETCALSPKVSVHLNEEVDRNFPKQRAAHIKVRTKDGRTFEHFQHARKGDPELPLSDDEISAKFTELATPVMGATHAPSLLDACWALDERDSIRTLPFSTDTSAQAAE